MNKKLNKFLSAAALIFFSVFAAVLFLEIAVRCFHLSKTAASYNKEKVAEFTSFFDFDNSRGILIYDHLKKNSSNVLDGITYRANSTGFRDGEFTVGAKNIFFFGSSVSFGYDIQAEDTFINLLEKEFRKNYNSDIYNFSMPGTLLDRHVENLKRHINIYTPSAVILQFSPSNFTFFDKKKSLPAEDVPSVITPANRPLVEKIKNLLRKSNLYLFIAERYNYFKLTLGLKLKQRYIVDSRARDFTFERLNDFISCCKTNNTPLYMLFIPDDHIFYRRQIIDEKKDAYLLIKEFCLKNNIILIDPTDYLKKSNKSNLFLDDCHLTVQGHRLIAEYLIEYFKENSLN